MKHVIESHGVALPRRTLKFRVLTRHDSKESKYYPRVDLERDRWDDFGHKTLFNAVFYLDSNTTVALGGVKILNTRQSRGATEITPSFSALPPEYASLGQDIRYYELLSELNPGHRRAILEGLRDVVAQGAPSPRVESHDGWNSSLLRFPAAINAFHEGATALSPAAQRGDNLSFQVKWTRHGSGLSIPFEFDASGLLPGRTHVLIGYNGVGKTTLLADIAIAASEGYEEVSSRKFSIISGKDLTFGAVISISYSAFDTFPRPRDSSDEDAEAGETGRFGYTYCGLRKGEEEHEDNRVASTELKSIDEIEREFFLALRMAREDSKSRRALKSALRILEQEPSFARAGVDVSDFASNSSGDLAEDFSLLSTGHKIVLNVTAQLAAHLRTRSLVLIDEPETHLHPPLMAALLRTINDLLKSHKSFAIIATHSPVIVQETPSKYVTMLERYGHDIEAKSATIETFGEDVAAITHYVFSLDNDATDFQGTLKRLIAERTFTEVNSLFPEGLSSQAHALVRTYESFK